MLNQQRNLLTVLPQSAQPIAKRLKQCCNGTIEGAATRTNAAINGGVSVRTNHSTTITVSTQPAAALSSMFLSLVPEVPSQSPLEVENLLKNDSLIRR